jgi:hypothetical protein
MKQHRISIRITKELLDSYRPYKIDQGTNDDSKEIFYYTALSHLVKNNTLPSLYEWLGDYPAIIIDVETNQILKRERKYVTDEELNEYKKYRTDLEFHMKMGNK